MEDYGAVRALENVRAVNGTPVTNESVFINTANVTDPRIRQALLLGMDRQLVFENLLEGNGELVDGFLQRQDSLKLNRLVLMDIDDRKRTIVGNLCERMIRKAGMGTEVVMTDDLDAALTGADFVVTQTA